LRNILLLVCISVLAFVLRFYGLGDNSLWLDEFTSLDIATKSLSDIVLGRGFNSHTPPFYYLVLHFWLQLFGANEIGLRSLSLFCDVVNVVLIYRVVILLTKDSRVSLIACLFYAISPYAIYYAQDGRMYTLLVCLCLLTSEAVLRFPFSSWISSVLFVILAAIGMYTHYYYALFLASISLFTLFRKDSDAKFRIHYLFLSFCIGLAFLPWLQVIRRIVASGGQSFREYIWSVLPYTFYRYGAGYGVMVLNTEAKRSIKETLLAHWPVLACYFLVFGLAIAGGLFVLRQQRNRAYRFALFALLGPALLALAVSQFTPMLSERYLVVSYPFFVFVIASLILHPRAHLLLAGCLCLFVYGSYQHVSNESLKNTDWRSTAKAILNSKRQCKSAFINPEYTSGLLRYYLPEHAIFSSKNEISLEQSPECLWLVERGTAPSMRQSFLNTGYSETEVQHFPYENGLTLRHLQKNQK
jgi:uncharacterized membrane protein